MMKSLEELKDKKILIVGLGVTGISLARLLVKYKASVTISDHKSRPELAENLEYLSGLPIHYDLGGHTPKVFLNHDIIVLSPKVPSHLKIFQYTSSHDIQVTGELDFVSQFIREPIIAVTGTNGKTTTAVLIERMLTKSGVKTWLGGNFGLPISEYLFQGKKADVVVLELSSFMLEHFKRCNPSEIVITNLAANHLDRYIDLEDYINAKNKIFSNVNKDTNSILNADNNAVLELARSPIVQQGCISYFSRRKSLESQIMNIGGAIHLCNEVRVRTGANIEYFSTDKMKMKGSHSVENMMAAILATRRHGVKSSAVQEVIDTFGGITHRMEYVRQLGKVKFFNDSKATNPHAVLSALRIFKEGVILIAGGKEGNLDFSILEDEVRKKVRTMILIGEAKEKINRDIGNCTETILIGTFEEAILMAYQKARIGESILLSPGCSSLDLFDSYIERGNYFKELVAKLK